MRIFVSVIAVAATACLLVAGSGSAGGGSTVVVPSGGADPGRRGPAPLRRRGRPRPERADAGADGGRRPRPDPRLQRPGQRPRRSLRGRCRGGAHRSRYGGRRQHPERRGDRALLLEWRQGRPADLRVGGDRRHLRRCDRRCSAGPCAVGVRPDGRRGRNAREVGRCLVQEHSEPEERGAMAGGVWAALFGQAPGTVRRTSTTTPRCSCSIGSVRPPLSTATAACRSTGPPLPPPSVGRRTTSVSPARSRSLPPRATASTITRLTAPVSSSACFAAIGKHHRPK